MQYPQLLCMYHKQNLVLFRFKVYHIHSKFVNTEQKNCLRVGGVRGGVLGFFCFTWCQFSFDWLIFFTDPGCSLFISLGRWKKGKRLNNKSQPYTICAGIIYFHSRFISCISFIKMVNVLVYTECLAQISCPTNLTNRKNFCVPFDYYRKELHH